MADLGTGEQEQSAEREVKRAEQLQMVARPGCAELIEARPERSGSRTAPRHCSLAARWDLVRRLARRSGWHICTSKVHGPPLKSQSRGCSGLPNQIYFRSPQVVCSVVAPAPRNRAKFKVSIRVSIHCPALCVDEGLRTGCASRTSSSQSRMAHCRQRRPAVKKITAGGGPELPQLSL